MFVADTLRAGAKVIEEALSNHGFKLYNNAITPSPWTFPAHASMFTGLYPLLHEAHEVPKDKEQLAKLRLKRKNVLSQKLKGVGYTTYLLSANPLIDPSLGFTGFDNFRSYFRYYDPYTILRDFTFLNISQKEFEYLKVLEKEVGNSRLRKVLALLKRRQYKLLAKRVAWRTIGNAHRIYRSISGWPLEKGSKQIFRELKKILLTEQGNPKFIFVNVMEMHEPYYSSDNPPRFIADALKLGKVDHAIKQRWKEGYQKEAELIKKRVLEFINFLKKYGLYDKVLIILTSDHGQLLGEHNAIGHGIFLYDELLRVPLLIKAPEGYVMLEPEEVSNKYYTHVYLKDLILGIINNDPRVVAKGFVNTVFAESYGLHIDIRRHLSPKEWERIAEIYEKHKVAIYFRNCKGVFDVSGWKFENIKCYGGESIEDIKKELQRKVASFLNMGLGMRKFKGIHSLFAKSRM